MKILCVLGLMSCLFISLVGQEAPLLEPVIDPNLVSQNRLFWIAQLSSPSPDLRINALDKLAELRDLQNLRPIVEKLQDPISEVRFHAISALAQIPYTETLDALEGQIQNEADPYIKSEMRRTIATIRDILKQQEEQKQKEIEKKLKNSSNSKK